MRFNCGANLGLHVCYAPMSKYLLLKRFKDVETFLGSRVGAASQRLIERWLTDLDCRRASR